MTENEKVKLNISGNIFKTALQNNISDIYRKLGNPTSFRFVTKSVNQIYFVKASNITWILFYPICAQCTVSLPSENSRKPYDFLSFSEGKERVHLVKTFSESINPVHNLTTDSMIQFIAI